MYWSEPILSVAGAANWRRARLPTPDQERSQQELRIHKCLQLFFNLSQSATFSKIWVKNLPVLRACFFLCFITIKHLKKDSKCLFYRWIRRRNQRKSRNQSPESEPTENGTAPQQCFLPFVPPLREINSQQNFVTDLCVMLCFFM